ncbi:MAG: hypothetical protein JSV17_00530 [Candidatus Aminicenantes bacterium]|nr:MAG: hypothetical protein JSV17_00530 [Candidatus Aminicenantes bacterium]
MANQKMDTHDQLQQHCRSLGHRVPFEYCRSMNTNLPCNKILACWKNILPIDEFISKHYTENEMSVFLAPTKPKLIQIFDLMKKAGDSER